MVCVSIGEIARVLRGQNNIVPALGPSDDVALVHHTTLVMEKLRLHRVQSFRDTLSYFVWVDPLAQDLLKLGAHVRTLEDAMGMPSHAGRIAGIARCALLALHLGDALEKHCLPRRQL